MNTTDFPTSDLDELRRAEQAFRDHLATLTERTPILDFDQMMAAITARPEATDRPLDVQDWARTDLPPSSLVTITTAPATLRPSAWKRWTAFGLAAAAVLVAVLLVSFATGLVHLRTPAVPVPAAPAPTTTPTPTASTTTPPVPPATGTILPRIVVNGTDQGPTKVDVPTRELAAVQAFADDIAGGNIDHLVAACYRQPPEEVRARFAGLDQRQSVLDALKSSPVTSGSGYSWSASGGAPLFFNGAEVSTSYACPIPDTLIRAAGRMPTSAQLKLNLVRLVDIHDGTPMAPDDADPAAAFLVCDSTNSAGLPGPTLDGIGSITETQWTLIRELTAAPLQVTQTDGEKNGLGIDFYVVTATDGSTSAHAVFILTDDGGYLFLKDVS